MNVVDRLKAVDALGDRIDTGAKFSALLSSNALATFAMNGPAAFVVPAGLRGGRVESAAGAFIQNISRAIGVVLVLRAANDATGKTLLPSLDVLIEDVIGAIVGWAPDEAIGVFALQRGELLSLATGTLIYQLDFEIDDQLRKYG